MVTVSEVVDMTLGAASGLMAEAGDGMVTLTWTPGKNAAKHAVLGVSKADFDAALVNADTVVAYAFSNAEDMHVVTGLTNGTMYYFWVAAGNDSGWGDGWVGPAMATPTAPASSVLPPLPSGS